MKKFEEPMVDVIAFATEDVLDSSSTGNGSGDDSGNTTIPSFMGAACITV